MICHRYIIKNNDKDNERNGDKFCFLIGYFNRFTNIIIGDRSVKNERLPKNDYFRIPFDGINSYTSN